MRSRQTLSAADRRLVAAWAADCAERVLWLFEVERPDDQRPRAAIERARAFASGDVSISEGIRGRFGNGNPAREVKSAAAVAAARAAGQAMAVCHMGAHALGAAAYAAKAAGLGSPENPEAAHQELCWQLAHMTADVRAALKSLPPIGEDRSGPLGPGLLSSGELGVRISQLQRLLANSSAAD